MQQNIYDLTSDRELENEFIVCLRKRSVEQKFLYMKEWADRFYKNKQDNDFYTQNDALLMSSDIEQFGLQYACNKDKNTMLISLWCGNALTEKSLLRKMVDNNYAFTYMWVDTSKRMLEIATDSIKDIDNLSYYFLCADFGSNVFKKEFNDLVSREHDDRIFMFLGNTFGNILPTNIIDILANLLNKEEKIWIGVCLRRGTRTIDDLKDFEMYTSWAQTPSVEDFLLSTLYSYWVKKWSWEIAVRSTKVKVLNAITYTISFAVKKKINLSLRYGSVILLPGEEIELIKIHAYDPDSLVSFFEEHNFNFVAKQCKEFSGQFLFERK